MSKMKAAMPAAHPYSVHEGLFRCPICHTSARLLNGKSMVCCKAHCFDIARSGYVNWLTHRIQTKYDKGMFEARKTMHDKGLFQPIDEFVAVQLKTRGAFRVLDAGCGEGSHLVRTHTATEAPNHVAVGIDISKEAIALAARQYPGSLWCVGDIGNLPFTNGGFDCILNVLSPSNYAEFHRVLCDGGVVVKVMPEPAYLQELRALLRDGQNAQNDLSRLALNLCRRNLSSLETTRIRYKFPITPQSIVPLVDMTPFKWGADVKHIERAMEAPPCEVTVDVTIAIGRRPSS